MNRVLAFAAAAEAATGVALLLNPPLPVRLLFGSGIVDAGLAMSRIAGIALIALGIACWPDGRSNRAPLYGMLAYGMLAALILAYVGITGQAGILLWPAVAVHAAISLLLMRTRPKRLP